MKIKEVCKKTRLSQKAVRYYTENGITTPVVSEMNGRFYKEYSDEDVKKLLITTKLRNLGVSVEDIALMFKSPETIPEVMKDTYIKIKEKRTAEDAVLENYTNTDFENINSLDEFDNAVTVLLKRKIMVEANPDFSKLDGMTDDQREELIRLLNERTKKRLQKGAIQKKYITISSLVVAVWYLLQLMILDSAILVFSVFSLWKLRPKTARIWCTIIFALFTVLLINGIPTAIENYTKVPATRYYIDSNGEYYPDYDAKIGDQNISALLEPTGNDQRMQEINKEGYETYIKAKAEHEKNKPFILVGIIIYFINTANLMIMLVMVIFSKCLREHLEYLEDHRKKKV